MSIRRVSGRGKALIKRFVGFRPRRHFCPAGVPSIGYGHALRPHEEFPEPMTEAEASAVLDEDLAPVEIYLTAVLPGLTQCQFDAVASLAHDIGLGTLEASPMMGRLRLGDVEGASDRFADWIYANKIALTGRMSRRAEERALFLGRDVG